MFEREAEEYYNGQYDAWLEGEEGYALEEEVEQAFKDGAEFGYNKVNEWHYVKDGDLPPERLEGKQILVVPQKHKFTEPMFVVGYYLLSEYRVGVEKKFYFDSDCRDEIDKPYAWKEIVLPEE